MYHDKLVGYIDSKQEEIVQTLCDFIRIDSISEDLQKVREALEFALKTGEKLGFKATSCVDGQVGVIETGEGNETLGILSHVDVVGPGEVEKWKSPPFSPVVREGRIFGRGALDDKGAIIASLYAMKAVQVLDTPFRKKVQLILGTQEEVRWTDMEAYVKSYPLPDYGFTPDGEFPMCNIEKGAMDIRMEFPLDQPEGEGPFLTSVHAGTATNIVPGVCFAEVVESVAGEPTKKLIKILGRSAHSCMPEKGDNAILKMANQISTMKLERNKLKELVFMVKDELGDLYGEGIGISSYSEYYNGEFVHRNVLAPTIFQVENGKATINVNLRTAYGTNEEIIRKAFESLAEKHGGKIVNIDRLPPVYVSKNRPFIQALSRAYEEVSGLKNEFTLAYGGSYAKSMPNIVSWGPIFPGEEDTCHEENENMSIKSLMDNAKIFAVAISKIVLSGKSFR